MEKIEHNILIEYCDKCAFKYSYPMEDEKEKGACKLCGRLGFINQVLVSSIVNFDGFNGETWKGGGYTIDQLIPFPPKQLKDTIHPTLSHRLLTEKIDLFFDKDILIIANPKTGQQIRIRF